VVQRFNEVGYDIQVGLTAKTVSPSGVEAVTLESSEALKQRLETVFGIVDPEIDSLWLKLVKVHEQFIASKDQKS
jgi:hypothetical protein